MPSHKKKADAEASGKSNPARKPGDSPFAGRTIHVAFDPDGDPSAPLECLAHEGNFLLVRGPDGELWVNLDHVVQVVVADDSGEPLAASLKAHESRYGPITVERKGGPQEAG